MKLKYSLLLAAAVLAGPTFAQSPAPANAGAALHAIFDREWEWELTQDPLWASYLGDRRWNDRWPDMTAGAIASRQAHRESVFKELASIPREQLSPADRLNYDLFRHQYQMTVEGFQHRQHLIRTSTLDGVQGTEFIIDSLRFQTVKDFEDWVGRLDAFPAYVDQNIALMREGMKANVLLPKVVMRRVREQIAQLVSQPADQSGYFRPFRTIPATIARPIATVSPTRPSKESARGCSRRSPVCSISSTANICPRVTTASAGGGPAAGLRATATSLDITPPPIWPRRTFTRSG